MGNISSCFNVQSNTAKLIDLRRNTLRLVDVPVTAAELMLEEPGFLVSPVADIRRDLRISALKADEILSGGVFYLLISVSRVNGKVSESEMAAIDSVSGRTRAKRRSSKVLPVVTEIGGDNTDIGRLSHRIKQWKPALEPIHEL